MAEKNDLDDILNDPPAEEPPPEIKPPPTDKGTEVPVSTEKTSSARAALREKELKARGEAVPPEKPPAAEIPPEKPPEQEMTAKEKAAFAKASDEAHKRQALEEENARLKQQLSSAPPAKPAEPEPPKAFWDDPEGALGKLKQEITSALITNRLHTAEMLARSRYSDFDENINIFRQLVTKAPLLWQQTLAAPDPAEFAYRLGKNHKDLQDAGNLDTLKAKLEKEIRLKVQEEYKKKMEAEAKEREALPGSLSGTRSVAQNEVLWDGPPPLEDILKH